LEKVEIFLRQQIAKKSPSEEISLGGLFFFAAKGRSGLFQGPFNFSMRQKNINNQKRLAKTP
jgi:hypothetical protein